MSRGGAIGAHETLPARRVAGPCPPSAQMACRARMRRSPLRRAGPARRAVCATWAWPGHLPGRDGTHSRRGTHPRRSHSRELDPVTRDRRSGARSRGLSVVTQRSRGSGHHRRPPPTRAQRGARCARPHSNNPIQRRASTRKGGAREAPPRAPRGLVHRRGAPREGVGHSNVR